MIGLNSNALDIHDVSETALFADSLSISVERLLEIVERVGPMRPAIRFYATRSAAEPAKGPSKLPRRSRGIDVPEARVET